VIVQRRSSRWRVAVASLLLASSLLVSGCVPAAVDVTPDVDDSPATGESVDVSLQPYYRQSLDWSDCGARAECATAIAPLDWNDAAAGVDVELALVRHRATGDVAGSLFINPGGPGASGVDFVRDNVNLAISARVREQYDVIGWDPRGVGASSAVSCFTDPREMDDFIYGVPSAKRNSPEWLDEVTQSAQSFVDACVENSGWLLPYVDTLSTVRDLDMLRAVVGDERLSYLGYSYGTEIGARYADEFPDRVGRLVLDGAIDPSATQFEIVLAQSIGFERALTVYLSECAPAETCPFPVDTDAALALVEQLYDRLAESPIPAADGRLFTDSVLDIAIATALYNRASWQFLGRMFTELRSGTVETGFLLADFYYGRDRNGYTNNSVEAFIAINCLSYVAERDPDVIRQQNDQIAAAAPVTSDPSPLGDVLCQNWPAEPRGDRTAVRAAGAPPILVIGTTGDPATPYVWAQALAEQLESGFLITYDGEGHVAYDEGDPCINDPVDDFFLTGAVPATDPVCPG
jgi:pimeloyl-ACP methyl ester carboxylesterase